MDKGTITEYFSAEKIQQRVRELAEQISNEYQDLKEPLVLIGVLKGSVIFLADLCRHMTIPVELDFIGVSSYGMETKSSGVVQITQDLSRPIHDRHVLLVEDIVDTGLTAQYLFENFESRKPASMRLCTFLHKPAKSKIDAELVHFVGFAIEDEFVIGYGMDLAEKYRNLPYLGVFSKN